MDHTPDTTTDQKPAPLPYEPPAITEIASVHELTLTNKNRNHVPDGYTFHGHVLTS